MGKCYPCDVAWHTWDKFWNSTGIAGVSNAGKAEHKSLRRVIWMIIFLVGCGFTIYGVWLVIADVLDYPVDTTITLEFSNRVCFMKSVNWLDRLL